MCSTRHSSSYDPSTGHSRQTPISLQDVTSTWSTMKMSVYSTGSSASINDALNVTPKQTPATSNQQKVPTSIKYFLPLWRHKYALPSMTSTSAFRNHTSCLQTKRDTGSYLLLQFLNTFTAVTFPFQSIKRGRTKKRNLLTCLVLQWRDLRNQHMSSSPTRKSLLQSIFKKN